MWQKIKQIFKFFRYLYEKKFLIYEMVKRDFYAQYIDSIFGLFWAFINPCIMILILWFIFSVGFKVQPVRDVPFVIWLTAGLAAWNFFSESLGNGTGAILQHSYLVKKVVFRVSILPIVKLFSSAILHLIFLFFLTILLFYYGYSFSLWWLQIFYYIFSLSIFVLGLSWLTSALTVFVKDVKQVVMICLQFGFWLTPIFWNAEMVPPKYRIFVKLNPMFYIIEGYRDSFIYHRPFWIHWKLTLYFWALTLVFLAIGVLTFKRLRPHFADVL